MNKDLRKTFENYISQTGAKWSVVEQDYLLSWVLYGISNTPKLLQHLVFKGGTALKKCYFGDYRFSQDLDFSVQGNYPKANELLKLLESACKKAEEHLQNLNYDVVIECRKYVERLPHPENQEAFTIKAKFPWHRELHTNIMVEVTTQEPILLLPNMKSIIHDYGEELSCEINVYRLEEIIAEKIRALLQFAKKLHERGWGRSRVRDYYDLWSIFTIYGSEIDNSILHTLISKKCEIKKIEFNSFTDIFNANLMRNIEEEWDIWLEGVVHTNLQHTKEKMILELKNILRSIPNM